MSSDVLLINSKNTSDSSIDTKSRSIQYFFVSGSEMFMAKYILHHQLHPAEFPLPKQLLLDESVFFFAAIPIHPF